MPIPPYYPELNPAEKVCQWIKDKIAIKIFDALDILENKVDEILKTI